MKNIKEYLGVASTESSPRDRYPGVVVMLCSNGECVVEGIPTDGARVHGILGDHNQVLPRL